VYGDHHDENDEPAVFEIKYHVTVLFNLDELFIINTETAVTKKNIYLINNEDNMDDSHDDCILAKHNHTN
jgi:hypothetical protein